MPRNRDVPVSGLRAALAVAEHRPEAIVRVFHTAGARKPIGALLSQLAKARKPYREIPDEELTKIAGTAHHEGLVVIARPIEVLRPDALVDPLLARGGLIMALDGVANPHNLGAILRSAAWFGCDGVVLGDVDRLRISAATHRVSQGAVELVPCASTFDLAAFLGWLRGRRVEVIGAEQRAHESAFALAAQPGAGPRCLVLGSETSGLRQKTRAACSRRVAIPGRAVESLNVSVAAGVLLALLRAGEGR